MKNNEYIHINEAVNVYNKTRQTFYNYIKKGQIISKKINNKIYLKISDIENILSDYIHINENQVLVDDEIIDPEGEYPSYNKFMQQEEKNKEKEINIIQNKLQKDMLRLHKQYYTLKDDLIYEIKHSKQDMLFDTKAISYNQEQRILTNISQQYKEMRQHTSQLNNKISQIILKNKKISFRLGYSSIILLQFIIANYIL